MNCDHGELLKTVLGARWQLFYTFRSVCVTKKYDGVIIKGWFEGETMLFV
jgi:hypothetical protein